MKKLIDFITSVFVLFFTILVSYGQNYKQPHTKVDKVGKITSHSGKFMGTIEKTGTLKNAEGKELATIDSKGDLIDSKTGKVIGHAPKNGSFVYFNHKGESETLTLSDPMNGTCEIKDKDGKTVAVVHENYKQYGACAYHCAVMKKHGKAMKMK